MSFDRNSAKSFQLELQSAVANISRGKHLTRYVILLVSCPTTHKFVRVVGYICGDFGFIYTMAQLFLHMASIVYYLMLNGGSNSWKRGLRILLVASSIPFYPLQSSLMILLE
jgi:hypothetical protein